MAVREFMPPPAAVAAIRADLERYEGERVRAWAAAKWRVPLFLGGLVAAMVLVAILLNGMAEPQQRWLTTAHIVLYVAAFYAARRLYKLAMAPARALRQSFR